MAAIAEHFDVHYTTVSRLVMAYEMAGLRGMLVLGFGNVIFFNYLILRDIFIFITFILLPVFRSIDPQ